MKTPAPTATYRAYIRGLQKQAAQLEASLADLGARRPPPPPGVGVPWLGEAYQNVRGAAAYLELEATMGQPGDYDEDTPAREDYWDQIGEAEYAEKVVRDTMVRLRPKNPKSRTVHPIKPATIRSQVFSSWLFPYRGHGAVDASPLVVYVFTESGNLRDPYDYGLTAYFDRVAAALRKDPLYGDAGWNSVNAAISYFWLELKALA